MKDAGRIGFVIRGPYSALEKYEFLDIVYYGDASYVAKKDVSGIAPEDESEHWQAFAKGWNSAGAVTGVKGAQEIDYRYGNVNLTPENIGALPALGKAFEAAAADKVAHPLTFTGWETGTYDGSASKSVEIPIPVSVKGEAEEEYRTGEVNITKENIGLGKVENMTPEEIRAGLTSEEVETALGYSPSDVTITVDDALDETSENPVQNKAIAGALAGKGDALVYDEDANELHLKSDGHILSTVTIEGGSGGGMKLAGPTGVTLTNVDEAVIIRWADPADIVIEGATQAAWAGTLVVRKVGSAPTSKTDGTIVVDSKTRDAYKETGFTDNGLTNGLTYYYGIFPYTTEKAYTYGTTDSVTPTAIYPDPPSDASVRVGGETLTVSFSLPENATSAKIAYSAQRPESVAAPYGTVISDVESPYTIAGLQNGTEYYVTVYSVNAKGRNAAGEMMSATPTVLFGFVIDQNESDPDSMITYIERNENFTPAHMDYANDRFDYGSWTVENGAWFMDVKPCMLNYDGTVAYYLDPNDYTKKIDGTPSDVANADFPGNAMVQIPKVYWEIVDNGDDTANVYVCDEKLNDNFVCWSHIDANENEIDYCYMSIYNSNTVSGRSRSLSGSTPSTSTAFSSEIARARSNNLTNDEIWNMGTFADATLVNILLMLIGKTTDSQSAFGMGLAGDGETHAALTPNGRMDKSGMFAGKDNAYAGVKVLGMENLWGNYSRRVLGLVRVGKNFLGKMTYGKCDGSTVIGYNTNGTGYIDLGESPLSDERGMIKKMRFANMCMLPRDVTGSTTTYYTDCSFGASENISPAVLGGCYFEGASVGMFYLRTEHSPECYWSTYYSTKLSCKPLAPEGGES